jgi:hypothetical protein
MGLTHVAVTVGNPADAGSSAAAIVGESIGEWTGQEKPAPISRSGLGE